MMRILFFSIAHVRYALLVRNLFMIKKMEFFREAVIYELIDGVLG